MTSKVARLFALGVLIAAASLTAVGPAQAEVFQTPGATACPAGYALMSVTEMEATGPYFVPRLTDAGGNNNGTDLQLAADAGTIAGGVPGDSGGSVAGTGPGAGRVEP